MAEGKKLGGSDEEHVRKVAAVSRRQTSKTTSYVQKRKPCI